MRNILFLIVIFFSSITILFSQENNIQKNKSIVRENIGIEDNFKFVSFTILNITSENERQDIINNFINNSNVKNIKITEHNQFSAYIEQDYINELKKYLNNNSYKTTINSNKPLGPNEGSTKIVIPDNMKPQYIDTGNPEADKKRYTEAKKQLLIEHPEFIQE